MGLKSKIASLNRIGKTSEERSKTMALRSLMGWSKLSVEERKKRMMNVRKNRWAFK